MKLPLQDDIDKQDDKNNAKQGIKYLSILLTRI